jgi:hypothetical protein
LLTELVKYVQHVKCIFGVGRHIDAECTMIVRKLPILAGLVKDAAVGGPLVGTELFLGKCLANHSRLMVETELEVARHDRAEREVRIRAQSVGN